MIDVLRSIDGGASVVEWFSGHPNFGDAEVLRLDLNRRGASLALSQSFSAKGHYGGAPFRHAIFTFHFGDAFFTVPPRKIRNLMYYYTIRRLFCHVGDADAIDFSMQGFSHQNVIGGLWLRFADDTKPDVSFVGTELGRGDIEFEFEPCFGPFGTLRATVTKITITPVEDYQKADEPTSMTE